MGGGQDSHYGEAYAGISVFTIPINDYREFFSIKLTESLISGKKYNAKFYVSLMDSMWYAAKNIGVYFSVDSITEQMNSSFFFSKIPQIKYTGTDYLTDKEGWMEVEGSFYADGGEQFITIGNFDNDENIDTLFVGGATGGILDKRQSYYYIDDVSIELDTLTGIEEHERVEFKVYPNPSENELFVEIKGDEITSARFELWNITGQKCKVLSLQAGVNKLLLTELSGGLYNYIIYVEDVRNQSGKHVIITR